MGYTEEEYLGRHIADFHADQVAIDDILYRLHNRVTIHDYEARLRCKDGSIKHVIIDSNVYWVDGEFVHTRCFTRDITGRKQVEEEIKSRQELEHRQSHDNATLSEIGRIITSSLDIEEVYDRFSAKLNEAIPFDRLVVNLLDGGRSQESKSFVKGIDVPGWGKGRVNPVAGSVGEFVANSRCSLLLGRETPEELIKRFPSLLPGIKAGLRSFLVVPLVARGQVIGCLWIGSTRSNAYTDREQGLAERISAYMSSAIANAALYAEQTAIRGQLEDRVHQQAAVVQIGQIAMNNLELDDFMEQTATLVAKTLGVEISNVMELLPSGQELLLRAGVGWQAGYVGSATVGASKDSLSGFTLLSSEPVIVADLRTENRFSTPQLLRSHGVVSGISAVIAGPDGPYGVLGAHAVEQRSFSSDDVNFLQAVANVLATGIEQDWTERSRNLLAETGALLSAQLDYEEILDRLANVVVPGFADWCYIRLASEDGQPSRQALAHIDESKLAQAEDLMKRYPPDPDSHHGSTQVMRTGQPELISQIDDKLLSEVARDEEHLKLIQRLGLSSVVTVPMLVGGRTIGTISLVSANQRRLYKPRDLELAQEIARRSALTIENARLFNSEREARIKAEEAQHRREAQYAISRALFESESIDEAAPRILSALGSILRWQMGALWVLDPSVNLVRCQAVWTENGVAGSEYETISMQSQFVPGEGFVGEVYHKCEPAWVRDILQEEGFLRRQALTNTGVHNALFLPLCTEQKQLGVLELFRYESKEADPALLQSLTILGNLIGQFIEWRWAEDLIRQISTPVLPIGEQILLAPLVGMLDTNRIDQLTNELLSSIRASRAKGVVVDITGVAFSSPEVAEHLVSLVKGANLVGATVVISGISAQVSQLLVGAKTNLAMFNSVGTLQAGIDEAERLISEKSAFGVSGRVRH